VLGRNANHSSGFLRLAQGFEVSEVTVIDDHHLVIGAANIWILGEVSPAIFHPHISTSVIIDTVRLRQEI